MEGRGRVLALEHIEAPTTLMSSCAQELVHLAHANVAKNHLDLAPSPTSSAISALRSRRPWKSGAKMLATWRRTGR